MKAWSTLILLVGHLAGALGVPRHLVGQDDLRLQRRQVDGDDLVVLGVVVGVRRLERPLRPALEVLGQQVVVGEERELGGQLGGDRGHGQTAVDVDPGEAVAVPLQVAAGEVAVLAGEVVDDVAGVDPLGQRSLQHHLGGGADQVPGLALAEDVEHLRWAHAPGEAVHGTRRAGVGVGVDQDLAGQGVALLGDEDVGDAVLADREVVLDAEALDELTHLLGVVGRLHRRRRHDVVVEQHELVGVGDLEDVGPGVVELHGDVDVDHDDVARPHDVLLGVAGEDLLDRVHARVCAWG